MWSQVNYKNVCFSKCILHNSDKHQGFFSDLYDSVDWGSKLSKFYYPIL